MAVAFKERTVSQEGQSENGSVHKKKLLLSHFYSKYLLTHPRHLAGRGGFRMGQAPCHGPCKSLEPSGGDRHVHVHGQLQLSVLGNVLGTTVGPCRAMGEQMVQD